MTDVNEYLMGGGGPPSARFPTIGTTVRGRILRAETSQQTDFDNNPKFWPDGKPMMQAVITLATDERDPEIDGDNGERRLFVKANMQKAVREAVITAGVKTLEVGGELAVQYSGDGERTKAGFNPPKLYTAQYRPPAVRVDDLLGGEEAPGRPSVSDLFPAS